MTVPFRWLSDKEARALTERIKSSAEVLWNLLLRAHDGRAWQALGYASWGAYVEVEFDMTKQRANQQARWKQLFPPCLREPPAT